MLFAAAMFEGLMAYGYLGIILYMILTGCGFPMPEEVAIIAGGVLSASGQLHWGLTLGSLLIGALAGDCVMYYLGRHFGRRLLDKNKLFNRMITPEREKKMEAMLAKHGVKVLLGARFLVGVRGPMYITAGILKVPFKRFVLADFFCATLVVTLFFGISYVYGAKIAQVIRDGEGWLTIIVLTVAVLAGGAFLWYALRRKKLEAKLAGEIKPAMSEPSENGQTQQVDDLAKQS
jgi:membrane protein DedA with SNARE-associated domain